MKILVISSCTAKKRGQRKKYIETSLLSPDNKNRLTARTLYLGRQHKKAVESVDLLREQGHDVDFYVLSAKYGLVNEDESILPYDVTFRNKSARTIREIAAKLEIDSRLLELYHNEYDVSCFLLSTKYVVAISEAIDELDNYPVMSIIFNDKRKSPGKHVQLLKIDQKLMQSFKERNLKTGGYVGIRGYLFNYFSNILKSKEKEFMKMVRSDPEQVKKWFTADFIGKILRNTSKSTNLLGYFLKGKSPVENTLNIYINSKNTLSVRNESLLEFFQ